MIANYRDAIEYLNNKQSLGIKPGLERIIKCLESLDNPQDKYKTIHIAGTNGKGTVAATLAKSLQKNGYKVGLFTSPWVVDFREQIQVDGEFICEDDLMNLVAELEKMQTDCTEFECLCAVAYMFFAKQNVDFAVVECGMGGKGDATNVEKENLSVITSISLDHTDFLGDT
ncbi:MAG: bifunctional folylpolyglutamate synthase/dihydrofolate synthase, partial [Eubacterium sp.]|nr:bifunctional folylpolyglutamate synthase/dihydrofolate synthase [Eubacterium sp.]